jgi:GTP-binding protein
VAIVGRPNVGKSTLFNRIVGRRAAIVEDRARTTRDRIYGEAEWNGRRFIAVDTGGLEVKPGDPIEERVQEQARLAIGEADVIVFVVDSISGLTPADQEAAVLLRTARAPVLVAANKADNEKRELEAAEFYSLGWEETYPISAAHGRGVQGWPRVRLRRSSWKARAGRRGPASRRRTSRSRSPWWAGRTSASRAC